MNRTAGRSPEPPRMEVRPIPGYEGYYATSEGTVIGKKGKGIGCFTHNYVMVGLGFGKTPRTRGYLVALAFLGPRPEGMEIDHIDRNKHNDRPENLRYVSRYEQMSNREYLQTNNTTGVRGLSYEPISNRWRVAIRKEGTLYEKIFHHTKRQEAVEWLQTTREQLGLALE